MMKIKQFLIALTASSLLATASLANAESSVWKVSKGDDYIYLGGTVHILPPSEFPLPKAYEQAYKDSQSIVLEADVPSDDDQQAQIQMIQRMVFTNGKTLKDVLAPKTYQALARLLTTYNANIQELQNFKPGFVTTLLAVFAAQKANLAGEGVDAYFSKKANKDKKLIEYLESLDFQINLIANLGKGHENELVNATIKQMDDFVPMMTSTIKAWRSGDRKLMAEVINEPFRIEDPQTYKTMFTDRNIDWIGKIEKLFTDKDKEFVLVGAGHLAGQDNVIGLLKKKGYKIEQM